MGESWYPRQSDMRHHKMLNTSNFAGNFQKDPQHQGTGIIYVKLSTSSIQFNDIPEFWSKWLSGLSYTTAQIYFRKMLMLEVSSRRIVENHLMSRLPPWSQGWWCTLKHKDWVCIWTKPTFYNGNNIVRDKPSFSSNLRRFRHDLLRDTSVVFLDATSYRASLSFVLFGINNIQQNKNWFGHQGMIGSLSSGMARNENQELTSGMVIRELQILLKPPWKATL